MANFKVTFVSGETQDVEASRCRTSGGWIRFEVDGREKVLIPAETVRIVDRTDDLKELCRWLRWPSVAILLIVGVFSALVGAFDMLAATGRSSRLFGGLLSFAGVWCLLSAYKFVWAPKDPVESRSGSAIVAGAIVASFLWLQVDADGWGFAELATVAFTVLAVVLVIGLIWLGGRPQLPFALGGLAVAGVLFGFGQFWYESEYLPTTGDPPVTTTVELSSSPASISASDPRYVTATIVIHNQSAGNVRIVGTHYNTWRFDPSSPLGNVDAEVEYQLVESGPLRLPVGNWLGPDQEYTESLVFQIASGGLRAMQVEVNVNMVKGDRIPGGKFVECAGVECARSWTIDEGSMVRRLTREQRYLVNAPRFEDDVAVIGSDNVVEHHRSQVGVSVCISTLKHACMGGNRSRHLSEEYGLFGVGAGAEIALVP